MKLIFFSPKTSFVVAFVMVMVFLNNHAIAANQVILNGNGVTFTSEFGSENPKPSVYYWCGHAALKLAEQYKSKTTRSLGQIHAIFLANSSAGYGASNGATRCKKESVGKKYCATLQDLAWAQYKRNGGYARVPDSVATNNLVALNLKSATNSKTFFANIKSAINAGSPVIAPSSITYDMDGHFWVVVGYLEASTADSSQLYVRDVALDAKDAKPNYDRQYSVGEFFKKTSNGQMLIVK